MKPADAPHPLLSSTVPLRLLQGSFILAVASFAWLRFSDNTVDNDLWGHVLYGQRYWLQGYVRGTEMFSWTAAGHPVVNHEYLAELVVGFVHRFTGGTGLWLYMLAMAAVTIGLAVGAGRGRNGEHRWTSLALLAASVNFIALGYAVRPQLFTTLCLVIELILLRRVAKGQLGWALALPPLIALWGNFHGGVLAGIVVLGVMTTVETFRALRPEFSLGLNSVASPPSTKNLQVYWATLFFATVALLINPWGYELVHWNVSAVLLPRPQIHEWHPLAFSAANVPFFVVVFLSLLSWLVSRQPRKLWEGATLLVLAAMGVLHQRHAPLFGLANLIFSPLHLQDAALRLAPRARSLLSALGRPTVQVVAALVLLGAAGASLFASFSPPKEHPFTMEVEKNLYPVAAVEFVQAHRLFGKTITFFDWGQQSIWELPHNPVSFDGRFDTGYPAPVIAAHWDFYRGAGLGPGVNWNEAELALLPTDSGGVTLLLKEGWRVVYRDPLAMVLVPTQGAYATFMAGQPPQLGGAGALHGRKPFPDALPLLATPAAPR